MAPAAKRVCVLGVGFDLAGEIIDGVRQFDGVGLVDPTFDAVLLHLELARLLHDDAAIPKLQRHAGDLLARGAGGRNLDAVLFDYHDLAIPVAAGKREGNRGERQKQSKQAAQCFEHGAAQGRKARQDRFKFNGTGSGLQWNCRLPRLAIGRRTFLCFRPCRPAFALSPTFSSLLYVADGSSHWVYSYHVQPDGSLAHKQKYYHLHVPDTADDSGAGGMRVDRDGRLYVATRLGVQVCDQAGRVNCIIPTPGGPIASLSFGGENFDTLFVTCGDKILQRKLKIKGANAFQAPFKPAPPKL